LITAGDKTIGISFHTFFIICTERVVSLVVLFSNTFPTHLSLTWGIGSDLALPQLKGSAPAFEIVTPVDSHQSHRSM
jgi:hypothetical protein